ncbi:putative type III secretion chaperone low calcium response protein H, partial [Chlamydia psittaci 84-8471/1]|jgi:hypothetical protein
LLYI